MKNFARLVRFALPYKLRFGLSIGCAAMVALLFFTELGAVYPLLHILFDKQDPQRWIAEKIDSIEDELHVLEARKAEARFVGDYATRRQGDFEELKTRIRDLQKDFQEREQALREQEGQFGDSVLTDAPDSKQSERLRSLRRGHLAAEARLKELRDCSSLLLKDDTASIARQRGDIDAEIGKETWWLGKYELAQPFINRYLPDDSFRCLLLLIAMVMLGVAFKGVFLFLQEVLVADVMQLTLLRIRNRFFRRTVNLDLASFSDQGSSELMARFTNDMDSFGQGLNTLDDEIDPRADADRVLPVRCAPVQLAADPADPDPRADLGGDDVPGRQDHEEGRPTLAREHVHDLQDPPGELPGDQDRQGVRDGARRAAPVLR